MIEAIVLAGGKGTRLQRLFPDVPKVLAPVGGRPFIDQVIESLVREDVERIILATGYLHEKIAEHFYGRRDAEFILSREHRALGTAGAIRKALGLVKGKRVLVLNGDSICPVSYASVLKHHSSSGALATMVVTGNSGRDDGGNVEVGPDGMVTGFHEKTQHAEARWLNAGIYVFETCADELVNAPEGCSLEREVIPALMHRRACAAYITEIKVTDIGTPERYRALEGG